MKWRTLPLETYDAYMNMAIDEALAEQVAKSGEPLIRFYTWKPSAVSIGYFQSIQDEVDIDACRAQDIDIVRRRTGGGAVFHSSEITYSVIGPVDMFPKDIIKSYEMICGWIINGLDNLGIKADFVPINDIVVGHKKISGNAQTRRNNVLLQHGTILYKVDVDTMFSVLKVPDEKMKDKIIKVVKERVTSIRKHSDVSSEEAYDALLKGFLEGKEYFVDELHQDEIERAMELAGARYSSKEWNYMR